jgi:hypothetical protein
MLLRILGKICAAPIQAAAFLSEACTSMPISDFFWRQLVGPAFRIIAPGSGAGGGPVEEAQKQHGKGPMIVNGKYQGS